MHAQQACLEYYGDKNILGRQRTSNEASGQYLKVQLINNQIIKHH
jgi:hypothetical protein